MNQTLSPQQLEKRIEQEDVPAVKFVLLQQLADKTVEEAEKLARKPQAKEKYEFAKQKYIQALQESRKLPDYKLECDILTDLGSTYDSLQEIDQAIESYEDALSIAKDIEDFIAQSDIYSKMGALFWGIGDINRVNEYLNLSADAAERAELSPSNGKEQTTTAPASKIPLRASRLTTIVHKSIQVSDEIKELKRLRVNQQRLTIISDILLFISALVIINGLPFSVSFRIILLLVFILAGTSLTYLAFAPPNSKKRLYSGGYE